MARINKLTTSELEGLASDPSIVPELGLHYDTDGSLFFSNGVAESKRVIGPGIVYGNNSDSSDGSNLDTIKFVPDYASYALGTDQFLTIDPRGTSNLHIRTGIDVATSSVDLFLGGASNYVKISDTDRKLSFKVTDANNRVREWQMADSGETILPGSFTIKDLFPLTFDAVLDATTFSPTTENPEFGGGQGWVFPVTFTVDPKGMIETTVVINDQESDIGYTIGDTFQFTETQHGIPNFSLFISITDIQFNFPAYIVTLAFTQAPELNASFKSASAFKMSVGENDFTFGTDGSIAFGNISMLNQGVFNGAPSIELIPSEAGLAQKLVISTAGFNNRIHIATGDNEQTNLYLGESDQYVRLTQDGNVEISAYNTLTLNSTKWQFRNDGTLVNDYASLWLKQETFVDANVGLYSDVLSPLNINSGTELRLTAGNKTVTLDSSGILRLPAGGDIRNSSNVSVLGGGGGSFAIPNTKKGFINLVGDKPNDNDEVWFESVAVHGEYAYVVGGDYYVDNSENRTKVYKFSLETGNQVWVKEIVAGRDAQINFDISAEEITIDSIAVGGVGYIVNEELYFGGGNWSGSTVTNMVTVVVDTVDGAGGILTASIKPGYNLTGIGDGAFNSRIADNDDAYGLPVSIAYDSYLDKLIIISAYRSGQGDVPFDSWYFWTNVYVVDPTTAVVNQTVTLGSAGDLYANSLKLKNTAGGLVVCGEKYGEFRLFGTLTIEQGSLGYFDILKSNLDPEHYPGSLYDQLYDFWVSGTGISTVENVDSVNDYPNLPTEVRQGTGATFDVVINATSTYSGVNIVSGGTNYRVGHKILIPGTSLEGLTPTNDITITVSSVASGGVIDGITFTAGSYGNAKAAPYTYSAVSGTNYQVGSGATITVSVNRQTGVVSLNYFDNTGSGYVNGDVLTIAGTLFAGGTSPANNVTFTINGLGGGGAANSWDNSTVAGSAPSDRLRIYVNGVDFTAVGGSWTMKQNLGGEAFVWTPTWSNAIGGPTGDRFYDVCYSQDGNSIFAVGRGRYETIYDQALVVKFNASTGAVIWGKDIKFSEATTNGREARSVCLVPGSSDLIVAGAWYNNSVGEDELILTRITEAGVAVWQKTYLFNDDGNNIDIDYEMKVEALGSDVVVSLETNTPQFNRALNYLIINPATGVIIDSRYLASDGNGNRNFYDMPTPNFSDIYTDGNGDNYIVMVGTTYVPTDNYYNAFMAKLPLDGYDELASGEWISIGEHILGKYTWDVTTVTPAFDSFTATEHTDTIEQAVDQRGYTTRTPDALLKVFTTTITKDSDGYLEFGDGSRQSFATNLIPQIPAANDYYLTEQDSGKHIFFEHENGHVYIPHRTVKDLPVGFTFTVVNLTGNDCYVTAQNQVGGGYRGRLKLAGRNINTYTIGIPDSGSGSMVTFLKIKSGYSMLNTDYDDEYPDVWIVSGPGDIYDND